MSTCIYIMNSTSMNTIVSHAYWIITHMHHVMYLMHDNSNAHAYETHSIININISHHTLITHKCKLMISNQLATLGLITGLTRPDAHTRAVTMISNRTLITQISYNPWVRHAYPSGHLSHVDQVPPAFHSAWPSLITQPDGMGIRVLYGLTGS